MGAISQKQFLDVSQANDEATFLKRLVEFAGHLDFGLVSGVVIRGELDAPDVVGRSVGNVPAGYVEASKSLDRAKRDPVMDRLMHSRLPFVYDQQLYLEAGSVELWETQAPFGYRTGVAMALHLAGGEHFFLGVDREKAVPKVEARRARLLADLQLLAVHAQSAATRLLLPPQQAHRLPPLTQRELEALKWTYAGKTAWVVGELMCLTERGVNYHLQNAMRKLEVADKHSAVLKLVSHGLLN